MEINSASSEEIFYFRALSEEGFGADILHRISV